MNPAPMLPNWPTPPRRPLKPVDLPSLVLVVAVIAVAARHPAYANGFNSEQITDLVLAAKTAVEWAAGVLSIIGSALIITIWRLSHTLTVLNHRVDHVEREQRKITEQIQAITNRPSSNRR